MRRFRPRFETLDARINPSSALGTAHSFTGPVKAGPLAFTHTGPAVVEPVSAAPAANTAPSIGRIADFVAMPGQRGGFFLPVNDGESSSRSLTITAFPLAEWRKNLSPSRRCRR